MPSGSEVRPGRWSDVLDLYDDGVFSVIWGTYEDGRHLATRWNGNNAGYPHQGSNPLWYIEPDFFTETILLRILSLNLGIGNRSDIDTEHIDNTYAALEDFIRLQM